MTSTRRVVITGVGAVTSLGNNVKNTWSGILSSKSGVSNITAFDTKKLPCKIASSVKSLNLDEFVAPQDARKMDRFIHFGLVAAAEAIADSNWKPETDEQKERTGVMVGSGIGGLSTIENISLEFHNSESGKITPYFIPASLVNLLPGHISIMYGFAGPNSAVATACSTGAHAIGDAARMIKYGDADVMIAGAAEAPITPVGVAGFAAARALSTNYNDDPEKASRPWDRNHDGFVMGEGAGIVVLEEYGHAVKRGAEIYAEICGYGLTGDAYHMTSPNGKGAFRAISNALKDANITPLDVDYINAHGTSTKLGDGIELNTVQNLFSENKKVKMSSTKSAIGHLLGAAGSVEAIFTVLAIRDQIAPPTLNLHNPIEGVNMDLVPLTAKKMPINYAISNSFGFGGTNASLAFRKIG